MEIDENLLNDKPALFCSILQDSYFINLIICILIFFLLCFSSLAGSGMRLGWQASFTNHVTMSYLSSNPSTWKWQLSWQGYAYCIFIYGASHLLIIMSFEGCVFFF